MNREIKFRAWDKNGDGMFYNIQNGISFEDGSQYDFSSFLEKQNDDIHDWIVMQYTGLKDKNGKSIYEGDVIKNKEKEISEIVFKEAGYWEKLKLSDGRYIHLRLNRVESRVNEIEVIGNIYENPELI